MTRLDAIIIGTGQSGPALAHRFAAAGKRVAIIERKLFGGTCVNNGCIPTKALIASARAAHVARRSADFGVIIDGAVRVDMNAVKARKDAIVKVSNEGVEEGLHEDPHIAVYVGHAHFVAPKQVAVGAEVLEAEQIFINVGGRAAVPPIPGMDTVPYLTNSSMMMVDFLPEHLVILGGSYIGLEFGQMYRRFGSDVTIIQRNDRLIPREDEDVSFAIRDILEEEGIRVLTDAAVTKVERRDGKVAVRVAASDEVSEVIGSHLLVATGRRPNTDDLGLEQAGVAVDERGYIKVDELAAQQRARHLGDRRLQRPRRVHAHFLQRLRDRRSQPLRRRGAPGRGTHHHLWPVHRPAARPRRHDRGGGQALGPQGAGRENADGGRRARLRERETQGFMKIIVDAECKQLLGAALLGIEGDEVVQGLLDMMYARRPTR